MADDLPPSTAAGSCPATRPLGAAEALSFVRHFRARCADQIAIDGEGSVVFRADEALGGGGYWRSHLEPFLPDGTPVGERGGNSELLVAGDDGFLSFFAPDTVHWIDGRWSASQEAHIRWAVRLPDVMMWPAWYAGLLAVAPGRGGELLVALAGVDRNGDAEVEVARVAPGPIFPTAPARAFTIPSPSAGWAEDRGATALRAAAGGVALGADGAGRILVVWDGAAACGPGTLAGRWLAPDGAPLGPVFLASRDHPALDARSGRRDLRLLPLPDGSLVLRRDDGRFVRRFAGGAPAGGPPPAWLAARAGEELAQLPAAGAVAAIRPPDAQGSARVDVVAAGGEVCRSHALPPQALDEVTLSFAGTPPPAVGVDGTVVALDRVEGSPGDAIARCRYRVWRGALR